MADIKISDMTSTTAFAGTSVIPIVESGSNKKITATNFFSHIQDPVIINYASEDNDTVIKGMTDSQLFYVDASTNRIGISKNNPTSLFDIDGDLCINGPEFNKSYNVQTTSGSSDLTYRTTIIDSSSAIAVQIGTGGDGQEKTIVRKGSGSVTITTTATMIGGSTVSLADVGSSVTFRYMNSAWYVISSHNATLS